MRSLQVSGEDAGGDQSIIRGVVKLLFLDLLPESIEEDRSSYTATIKIKAGVPAKEKAASVS